MSRLFLPYNLSVLAEEKGFIGKALGWYIKDTEVLQLYRSTYYDYETITAPLYQQIIDWFRDFHKIEITIMPVFRDKCGYDSFKRDGYTYQIVKIEPCQFLTWNDFNCCAEDRDEESGLSSEDRSLNPSLPDYYDVLTLAIEEAFKLI